MNGILKHHKLNSGSSVFISHSSRDRDLASEIVSILSNLGIESWIAPGSIAPGEDWTDSILQAITDAGALLLLGTDSSFSSGQVRREIERAADKGIPILALLSDESAFPSWLRYYIQEENCLIFSKDDISSAVLNVMLMLQGKSFYPAKKLQQERGLFSGESRPVYVLLVSIGEQTPIWLQTSMLTSIEHICNGYGAVQIPSVLPGVLHIFDSLALGTALEKAIQCGIELEQFLNASQIENGLSVCCGIGLGVSTATSSSTVELVREIDKTVKDCWKLADTIVGKFLISCELQKRCVFLSRFKKHSSLGFTVETLTAQQGGECTGQSVQMIARKAELSGLLTAVRVLKEESVEAGLGCIPHKVIGVRGSIGLGKSRLVQEFVTALQARSDVTVAPVLSIDSSWKHDGLWDSLLRQLQTVLNEKADLQEIEGLRILLDLDGSGCSTEPVIEELENWRRDLFKILEKIASRNPLVVVLEDIDQADSSSLETLRTLIGSSSFNARILFILTYSDSMMSMTNLISLPDRNGSFVNEIELKPLDASDSEKLILSLMQTTAGGSISTDQRLINVLLDLGGGNPLLHSQLVEYSSDQNLLSSQYGRLGQINEYDFLAPAMEAAALSLLSSFDRSERDLLRIVSLFDKEFSINQIIAYCGGQFSLDYLGEQLLKLVKKGVLVVNRDSFLVKYKFAYKYIKLVACNTIPQVDLTLFKSERPV